MKALLYEVYETEGSAPEIVDYGVRIEERELFQRILPHIMRYADEQNDAVRHAEIANFLDLSEAEGTEPETKYFDITLTEARFAYKSLLVSKDKIDKKAVPPLKGCIDAESAFMLGQHRSKHKVVKDVYAGFYISISTVKENAEEKSAA